MGRELFVTKTKRYVLLLFAICFAFTFTSCQESHRDIYQLKIYSLENEQQEKRMDRFLEHAYIPALNRSGINNVGVFKPIDTAKVVNKLYVFIPFNSIKQFEDLDDILLRDKIYKEAGKDYINAAHDDAPYERINSVLLRSFKSMPKYGIPDHQSDPSERIYELRSYEASTEKLYQKKVEMFDDGGESKIFIDLGFQPIFFGEVISGESMPNLMYMTTFENEKSNKEHWEAFRDSPDWHALKGDVQYENTVSHIDKYYLHSTDFSQL